MRPSRDVLSPAATRAASAWRALLDHCVDRDRQPWRIRDRADGRRAAAWPVSQVLHAAVLSAEVHAALPPDVDDVFEVMDRFRRGDAYRSTLQRRLAPATGAVFYDDNAWIGLAAVEHALLTGQDTHLPMADRALQVVMSGEHRDGGVLWRVGAASRHACATAPAAELALRMIDLDRAGDDALGFARRGAAFLRESLSDGQGLIRDNINATGAVESTIWSYNQGATIATHVLLHAFDDDPLALDNAQGLADATLRHYGAGDSDRLWAESPAFVAILCRGLLLLDAAAADDKLATFVAEYAHRLVESGRNVDTGLFTEGGIGRYERSTVIDQAGAVQILAMTAMDERSGLTLC